MPLQQTKSPVTPSARQTQQMSETNHNNTASHDPSPGISSDRGTTLEQLVADIKTEIETYRDTDIQTTNEAPFKILRRISTAKIRSDHHTRVLQELLDINRIPKGLSIKRLPLNLPDITTSVKI